MLKQFFFKKIGNDRTDKKLEQFIVSTLGIAFFILIVRKLSSMEITEFQMIIGITIAAIFMLLCGIYAGLLERLK